MRTFLALSMGCVLAAGCGGGGGGASSVPPAQSNGITGGATGSANVERLLVAGATFLLWDSQSPLTVLGTTTYSCPNTQVSSSLRFAFTPGFNRVYVVGPDDTGQSVTSNILEFDGTNYSLRREIPVGPLRTQAVAVTPDGTKLYVGVEPLQSVGLPSDSLQVFDVARGTLLKTIPLQMNGGPLRSAIEWMVADHSGAHVYLFATESKFGLGGSELLRIDTSDDSVHFSEAAYGGEVTLLPDGLRVTPDDTTINFAIAGSSFVAGLYAVDAATGAIVKMIPAPSALQGFAAYGEATSGSTLYADEFQKSSTPNTPTTNTLLTLDPRTLATKGEATVNLPSVISVAAGSSGRVFLHGQLPSSAFTIEAVDPATGNVLDSITTPQANSIFAQ